MCDDLLNQVLAAPPPLPIIVVTAASPATAAAWASERGFPPSVTVVCDERRALHAALGLARGVARTFTFRRGCANVRGLLSFPFELCCKRRLPGVNAGDPWQQAGVLVLRASGEAAFAHRETSPGWPLLDAAGVAAAAREVAKGGRMAPLGGGGGAARKRR
jgi:hypothetical protein